MLLLSVSAVLLFLFIYLICFEVDAIFVNFKV